jgi:hypothetical protein
MACAARGFGDIEVRSSKVANEVKCRSGFIFLRLDRDIAPVHRIRALLDE